MRHVRCLESCPAHLCGRASCHGLHPAQTAVFTHHFTQELGGKIWDAVNRVRRFQHLLKLRLFVCWASPTDFTVVISSVPLWRQQRMITDELHAWLKPFDHLTEIFVKRRRERYAKFITHT
ncbi:hypothetical protein GCM10027267_24460 [Paramicrobacterium agarici]